MKRLFFDCVNAIQMDQIAIADEDGRPKICAFSS